MPRLRHAVIALLAALAAASGAATPAAAADGPQGRIVNGREITIGSAPWQVDVWSRGGASEFDCGGSILDQSTILTAAHCTTGVDLTKAADQGGLGVWAGTSNLDGDAPGDNFQQRTVSSMRVHPSWNPVTVATSGDLAVLTLANPLDLDGTTATAIALPPVTAPVDFDPIPIPGAYTVSGFGLRDATDDTSAGALFALDTAVVDASNCAGNAYENAISLCVQTPIGTACSGDSGGALVAAGAVAVEYGVVSNGPINCLPGDADSYVNLAAPENRLFLAGVASPPIAPRQQQPLRAYAPDGMVVGKAITCGGGDWTGSPVIKWTLSDGSGAVLSSGRGVALTYVIRDTDIGHLLQCRATAGNAGGVAVAGPFAATGVVRGATAPGGVAGGAPGTAAVVFRLNEFTLKATAKKSGKRGAVVKINVAAANLFASADTGTLCAKQGSSKAKCVALTLTGKATSASAFSFRISRKAKVKSLQKFTFQLIAAGRNTTTGKTVQVTRTAAANVRVIR